MLENFETADIEVDDVTIHLRLGGEGPPLLLLHGFPQTHVIWHKVADELARRFTLVMPDLRGYGDSSRPPGEPGHANYSKRAMAQDMVELMRVLGHPSFYLCGHDRGGRVAHRLALDHPEAVKKLMILDISPTRTMYEATDKTFATLYYHWFFLIQPYPVPETLIGNSAAFLLRATLGNWGSNGAQFIDPEAMAEYERCFVRPDAIHAACEDYRAAAGIDLEHDRDHETTRIACPVRVLWGEHGVVGRLFKPLEDWQAKCVLPVTGKAVPAGHFIPEQVPDLLLADMLAFFGEE
ncbi:MAG TPA: alpha/beta hydrolase [Noviherbaspirillum sp.]|uniref:alpha/beta fold hydrolase n=1 Tax=Noviherbaspirillum sp. TaxID=1926288 RepID=UPI002D56CDBF|nr:alpha/beta hydrolase [Noviherbaspirillum sp.]HYD95053.1 alpha/beta hydrolase [Noviherbaspirillum sp.]